MLVVFLLFPLCSDAVFGTTVSNAVSCGVKSSYQCDPCVFCVCFFSEIQVWDPRSACAGASKCACACTGAREPLKSA